MTSTDAPSAVRFAYRYGNPVVECDGAQLRAQCRQLATVVTVSGIVDAQNLERVSAYARRFVLAEKPFVLDLGAVTAFSSPAMALLRAVDEACGVTAVQWCLVTSEPVSNVLRAFAGYADYADYTTASSVPEALSYFRDAMNERRRLLPVLHKTA